MKQFSWDHEKNERLKTERNITFEEVIFAIDRGRLIDVVQNPNQEKYSGQRILIVEIHDYAYLVPFIETNEEIHLITVIPSRKATRKYLRG